MPNPDVDLNDLEFDFPRVELLQIETSIGDTTQHRKAPNVECRLDEFEEVREQLAQRLT